ncbi:MAG: hypothetical protein JKY42_05970 [Flavobacteriales bacterium]|nr:hypothetical protein [Flavobacteriales bacterium]
MAKEAAEADRLAKIEAAKLKAEQDRLAKEAADAACQAEKDRLAEEKRLAGEAAAEEARLAEEKRLSDKAAAEEAKQAKIEAAKLKAEQDRLAQEAADAAAQIEKDRLAEEKRFADEATAQAERDRLAREAANAAAEAEKDRLAREAADAERLAEIEAAKEAARKKNEAEEAAAEAARLARLDQISSEQHSLSEYRDVIDRADLHFNFKKYNEALKEYETASAMRPDQKHPKERIDQIIKILGIQASRANAGSKTVEDHHLPKEDFRNKIALKYPEGITEEVETLGNKVITRRFVVKGHHGDEYKMIRHSWGGKFFFKNDQQITELLWNQETRP